MPTYQFRCRWCHYEQSYTWTIEEYSRNREGYGIICPFDNISMARVYTPFSLKPSFADGYNHALGRYVATERDLDRGFKQASEEATIRTGLEHRFVPHDPRDLDVAKSLGVTDEGLDATRARKRDLGLTERKSFG